MKTSIISSYCLLKNNQAIINSNSGFSQKPGISLELFLGSLYKSENINYPKFYKMDNLSKLAFISTELILNKFDAFKYYSAEEVGVVICNSTSSLDSDVKFYETISDKSKYFPSPALFVYTLPNIMIGEICIRYKFMGENAFFIFEKFDPDFINWYVNNLFNSGKIKCCITGWVDLTAENYEAFLLLVEKEKLSNSKFNMECDPENLTMLYQGR